MIVGLVPPESGRILVDENDITHVPMYLRARNFGISYLPQEPSVFRKLSVADNIRVAVEVASGHRLRPWLAGRTRAEWAAFGAEHDCCLEPVLGLDETLDSELVRAREMVVSLDQPGAERPVRLLGLPIKLSRTPGDPSRAPGPGLGEHTDAVLGEAGFAPAEITRLRAQGAVGGADAGSGPTFMSG